MVRWTGLTIVLVQPYDGGGREAGELEGEKNVFPGRTAHLSSKSVQCKYGVSFRRIGGQQKKEGKKVHGELLYSTDRTAGGSTRSCVRCHETGKGYRGDKTFALES